MQDQIGLGIFPGTPPGVYEVILALYGRDGSRLTVSQDGTGVGDHLVLGSLEVTRPDAPPSPEALGIMARREVAFGPLRLLGYNLTRLGGGAGPDVVLMPGEVLELILFWQVMAPPSTSPSLDLLISGPEGEAAVAQGIPPSEGLHPYDLWREGEIIRDPHHLILPSELVPGRYRILMRVGDGEGGALGPGTLDLGLVTIPG